MSQTIGSLLIRVGADTKSLDRALKDMEKNLSKAGKNIQSIGDSLLKVSAPFAALGGISIKMAMDFESSMTKIESLVGLSRDEVEKMSPAVKKMAADMGISSKQAADALFFITSAGLRGKDAMDALEMSLKASASGLGEVETIADLVTSAMNAYGSETLSASNATDILVAAVKEGKLEASELSAAMGSVLPVASNMGVTFDQVGAAMASMSRTGTSASEAATQLNGIMAALLKPSVQAEKALAEYGLSAQELRRQMREEGLLATLENLKNTFGENEEATARVFGNVNALKGVMDMLGAGVETTREIFGNMTETTGMLDAAFERTSETAQFRLNQTMERAKNIALDLGETLLPVFNSIIDTIQRFVARLQSMDPAILENVVKIGLLVGGLGVAIKVIGVTISTVGSLIAIVTKVKMAFTALTVATKILYAILAANPIGLIIAAATALVAVIVSAIRNFEKWGAAVLAFMGPIGILINAIVSVKKNWESVKEAFTTDGIIGGLKRLGQVLLDAILLPLQQILELASKIPGVGKYFDGLKDKVENLRTSMGLVNSEMDKMQKKATDVLDPFGMNMFKRPAAGGEDAGGTTSGGVVPKAKPEDAENTKKEIEKVKKALVDIPPVLNDVNSKISAGFKKMQEEVKEANNGITKSITEETEKQRAISEENIHNGIVNHLEQLIQKSHEVKEAFAGMTESSITVAEGFQEMQEELKDAIQNGNVLEGTFGSMAAGIADAAMKGATSMRELASAAVESGAKTIRSFIMEGVAGYVKNTLSMFPAPFGAVAAAVAGGAAVTLFNKVLGKVKPPALAEGGLAYGPTLAMVGDNLNAHIKPEVIAPLDKFEDMMTPPKIVVEWPKSGFRLDGRDLLLAMERSESILNRTR